MGNGNTIHISNSRACVHLSPGRRYDVRLLGLGYLWTVPNQKSKMADEELAGLRANRMAELQQQLGGQEVQKLQQQQQQQEAIQRENEMRGAMLSQILDQSARARLSSIAIVKPEKAKMVESMLIQMAQTGQLPGKVGEAQLVNLLEKVSEQTQKKTTVKFNRRRYDVDDDDDY